MKYKYNGKGFIPGIPARDLTTADLRALKISEEDLLKTKLYEAVKPRKEKHDLRY